MQGTLYAPALPRHRPQPVKSLQNMKFLLWSTWALGAIGLIAGQHTSISSTPNPTPTPTPTGAGPSTITNQPNITVETSVITSEIVEVVPITSTGTNNEPVANPTSTPGQANQPQNSGHPIVAGIVLLFKIQI